MIEYPCIMWTVRDGEVMSMRFKENAPLDKPGWYTNKDYAEASLNNGQPKPQPKPEPENPTPAGSKRRGWPKGKPRKSRQ